MRPYFLPPRLTGAVYREFLTNVLRRAVARCRYAD